MREISVANVVWEHWKLNMDSSEPSSNEWSILASLLVGNWSLVAIWWESPARKCEAFSSLALNTILRDVRSGRAKMQIRHEPPAIWVNSKTNAYMVNVRNPACDFQAKVGSDKYSCWCRNGKTEMRRHRFMIMILHPTYRVSMGRWNTDASQTGGWPQEGKRNFEERRTMTVADNRPTNYDDLPLVLDIKEMQKVLGISRTTAYQLVHEEGFPAFRSGNRIKISKEALFEWMAKGRA